MFDNIILQELGDSLAKSKKPDAPDHVLYSDGINLDSFQLFNDNDPVMQDGTDVFEKPPTDQLICAELNLSLGEILQAAKVVSRTKDGNGDAKGSHDPKTFLRTLTCMSN